MQRTTCTKKQIRHIQTVLDTSDATLNPPARALLEKMLPPDVREDHAQLIKLFDEQQGFIKTIFRYYAVEGAVGMSEVDSMGVQQFAGFCKECHIKLSNKAEIDQVFIRSNRDNSIAMVKHGLEHSGVDCEATRDFELLKYIQPDRDNWRRQIPLDSKHMCVPEFVAALVRLATRLYPSEPSISARVAILFKEKIDGNACCSTEGDAVTEVLQCREIVEVFNHPDRAEELQHKFDELKMLDNTDNHDEMQCNNINMDAYMDFLLDAGLLGKEFTAKDARRIFVKVNIDDELFENSAENKFDSADGLTMEEFQECIVRVLVELECTTLGGPDAESKMDGATVHFDISPLELAPMLDAFIAKICQLHPGKKKKKSKGKK